MRLKPGDLYSNADNTFIILLVREEKEGLWRSLVLGERGRDPEFVMANFKGFTGWVFFSSLDS